MDHFYREWEHKLHWHNPHHVLGLHPIGGGKKIIRLWRPGAVQVYIEVKGEIVEARAIGYGGIFTVEVEDDIEVLDYRVYHSSGLLSYDPYSFAPTFGEVDAYLFSKGVHYQLYEALGGRICHHGGCDGVKFAVWAPLAKRVSLIGDFNHWDSGANPMRTTGSSGVWEIFVPGLQRGEKYKFEIYTQDDQCLVKTDPFAYCSEKRPLNASVIIDVNHHVWQDISWREKKRHPPLASAMNIYEVHLGSWRKEEEFPNYKSIARELASYCTEMGFTHVELLPLSEHPLDESWGYQVSGFYAVTSRYGTAEDFQCFIDILHQSGIGVIVDWVGAHFPKDAFALARFDGTPLYEHEDPRQGEHPHWDTYIFNYGRYEVSNFLLGSVLFWLDKMRVDGLRIDAVASMLYLDYGRKEGEWIPNIYGGKENLEAIEFLKHMNSVVHQLFPNALIIAEESTAFYGVTRSLQWGGLGFDLKWNMGWMNDTLSYFKTDSFFRTHHQDNLTFGQCYAYSEQFILPLSHDEVVHGKGSLLAKMPGDEWQKFANLRLLYSYMICQPGKKLFFMGGEIAQWKEWNCKESLEWFLLQYPLHFGMSLMVKEINWLYQGRSALWERDFDQKGFSWVDFADRTNSVISYLRKSEKEILLCVHNFTPAYFPSYTIGLARVRRIQEVFSSDRKEYGGSDKVGGPIQVQEGSIIIELAPLATMIFEVCFEN